MTNDSGNPWAKPMRPIMHGPRSGVGMTALQDRIAAENPPPSPPAPGSQDLIDATTRERRVAENREKLKFAVNARLTESIKAAGAQCERGLADAEKQRKEQIRRRAIATGTNATHSTPDEWAEYRATCDAIARAHAEALGAARIIARDEFDRVEKMTDNEMRMELLAE